MASSLALEQSYDCHSASGVTLKDMHIIGQNLTPIKHNKTWTWASVLGYNTFQRTEPGLYWDWRSGCIYWAVKWQPDCVGLTQSQNMIWPLWWKFPLWSSTLSVCWHNFWVLWYLGISFPIMPFDQKIYEIIDSCHCEQSNKWIWKTCTPHFHKQIHIQQKIGICVSPMSIQICEDITMKGTIYIVLRLPQPGMAGGNPLQWHHNGRDGVSNHQPHHCLLNHVFRHRSKKTSKLRVTGLCAGNSPVIGEFPAQMASNAENISIWWRHHAMQLLWKISYLTAWYWAVLLRD